MINIKNMSFGYERKRNLYHNVSYEFEKGKIYGILGKNGSGKTTLLNIITSLLPNYNGSVNIEGIEANKRTRGYLQKVYYMPEIATGKNLRISDLAKLGRCYEKWDEEKFNYLINREGLDTTKRLQKFSKGWQKRIDFYLAISTNPEILILDEVTEGVDMLAQKDMIADILEYFDEEKTIIIASHHIEEIENIIDEFIIIDDGKFIFSGQKDYIDKNFGWIDNSSLDNIKEEDILMEKKILGIQYFLVKNKGKYTNIKFMNIDLATFLKIMIEKKGGANE